VLKIKEESVREYIDEYSKKVEENPSENLYYKRALLYAELREYENTLSDLDRAIEKNQNNESYYFQRAMAYSRSYYEARENRETKTLELALEAIDRAIELNPYRGYYYVKKAVFHKDLKEYEKAISTHKEKIEKFYDNEMTYFILAKLYLELERYLEAVETYSRLLEIKPVNNFAYNYHRGLCYAELGEYEKAIEDCQEAIVVAKKYMNPYHENETNNFIKECSENIERIKEKLKS